MRDLYDKPIPITPEITLMVEDGLEEYTIIEVEIQPDEGYKFDLSYILVSLKEAEDLFLQAIIVYANGEDSVLHFGEHADEVMIDATDLKGVLIDKIKFVFKTYYGTSQPNTIRIWLGGREVTPWV